MSFVLLRGPRLLLFIAFVALLVGACARGDYLGAAVTGGLGVAGAGVHRATTKGCWGQCLHGLVCDRESGTCVEQARCGGKCARNERCEEGTVPRCVSIGELPSASDPSREGNKLESDAGVSSEDVGADASSLAIDASTVPSMKP